MNTRKAVSILSILCFVTLMLGLAVMLFSSEAIAANDPTETKQLMREGNSSPSTTSLTATNSISDINSNMVALVLQPGQNQLHAFSAVTGEWTSLGGNGFKVRPDDIVIVSKLLILVAQPGQDQLHAFSALTGEWATLAGTGVKVAPDDVVKVSDSIIIVAQPGPDQIHAYSALTGEWATLSGSDIKVAPEDKLLVGTEN